jgi:Protein of unknown function (DUF3618)
VLPALVILLQAAGVALIAAKIATVRASSILGGATLAIGFVLLALDQSAESGAPSAHEDNRTASTRRRGGEIFNGGTIMGPHSEQLEREAEEARCRLAGSLEELRLRISPGEVVDQIVDYAREGPVADFARNLMREMRDNPAPLLLIAAGIAWLVAANRRSSRSTTMIERPRDSEITSPPDASPPDASPIKVASAGKTAIQHPRVLTRAGA